LQSLCPRLRFGILADKLKEVHVALIHSLISLMRKDSRTELTDKKDAMPNCLTTPHRKVDEAKDETLDPHAFSKRQKLQLCPNQGSKNID